jgi:hypothetical protein
MVLEAELDNRGYD